MSQTPSSDEDSTDELPKEDVPRLARLVEETKSYAFLIGAGTSRPTPSEIKTAGELIEEWQKECYESQHFEENDPDNEVVRGWAEEQEESDGVADGDEYGYWFERLLPTIEARRERIKELVEGADPTTGHLVLASMMSDRRGDQYVPLTVTPNFDDLLLDAFYLLSAERPQIVSHGANVPELQITREGPAILKLHGDYLYRPLNTKDETNTLQKRMAEALGRTVDEYGLIVVGYSGRDDSIMSVLEDAEFPDHGLYWCVREPQEDDEANTVDEKISDRAADLVRETGGEVVPIEGFNSLMSQFNRQFDGLPPLKDREELERRFNEQLDRINTIFDEREDAEPGEAEEELLDAAELSRRAYEAIDADENERAIELYDKLIESEGADPTSLDRRGTAKKGIGEFRAAIEDHSRAIEMEPDSPIYYNNRGNSRQLVGEYKSAIRDYNKAIELYPEYALAYNNRGNVKRKIDQYESATTDLNQAIEINPRMGKAYNNLGKVMWNLGEYETAIENFNKAIEHNPEYSNAYENRGSVRAELSRYEAAIKDINKAINVGSESSAKYTNLGSVKHRIGKLEDALEDHNKAIDLNPEDSAAYNNRGLTKRSLGMYEDAIEDYNQAIELDPEDPTSLCNRSEIYIELGKFDNSKYDAEEANVNSESTETEAGSILLYLISTVLLGEDTQPEEQEYRKLCQQDFTTSWNFTELDNWLEDTDLEPEKEAKISELIDLLREHKPDYR